LKEKRLVKKGNQVAAIQDRLRLARSYGGSVDKSLKKGTCKVEGVPNQLNNKKRVQKTRHQGGSRAYRREEREQLVSKNLGFRNFMRKQERC